MSESIRRILVAVKEPAGRVSPALVKAAQIARAVQAELVLFHAIDLPICAEAYVSSERTLEQDRDGIRADFLEALEHLAKPLLAAGLAVSIAAEWDFPAYEAILRRAAHDQTDLIVADHRHSAHGTLWATHPTDWELLRLSPYPLLLVKTSGPYGAAPILAAVDPTHRHAKPLDLDAHICTWAQQLGATLTAPWHLVHAAATERTEAPAAARTAVEELLRPLSLQPQQLHVVTGRPGEIIPQTARELGSAIVVMGAVSRSGLPGLVIGNTAEQLIDALPCDLLIVKPDGFGVRYPQAIRGMNIYSVLTASPG